MEILIGLVAAVLAVFVLVPLMGSKRTKLFRRVWSSERVGGGYGYEKQHEAIRELLTEFGVDFHADDEILRANIGDLLAAATEFDVRNPNNLGVQVMPVLANRLSANFGLRTKPEIAAELSTMALVDGVSVHKALMQSIPEVARDWQSRQP